MKQEALEKISEIVKEYFLKKTAAEKNEKPFVSVGYPAFDEKEVNAVINAMLGLNISQGKFVKKFEEMFANYIGTKHAAAVNSGSSANLLALTALMENSDLVAGDEVIVPAATFPTVASPIIKLGLVPVFVDVQQSSYNIDPEEIRKAISPKTKLVMPVHSLGNPCEMKQIQEIAQKHGLKILEDCCEAHGAKIGSKIVGAFGDLATISLFVAHHITTGEGGLVFSDKKEYDEIVRSVREFGRINQSIGRFEYSDKDLKNYDKRFVFTRLGYNMRMTDIAASIGIEQLKKIDQAVKIRINNAEYFNKNLDKFSHYLFLPETRPNTTHTFYSYPITVKENAPFKRKELVVFLEQNGIETRPFFGGCLPLQPAFRNETKKVVGNLVVSKNIEKNTFYIGCHQKIGKRETDFVVEKISEFMKKFNT